MAESSAFQLDPALMDELADRLIEAIAARVVEVMRAEGLIPRARTGKTWLEAKEVARELGVSREWVYEHAEELGGSRIGSGPRPRLRFPAQVLDSPADKLASAQAVSQPTTPRRKTTGLIPIRVS